MILVEIRYGGDISGYSKSLVVMGLVIALLLTLLLRPFASGAGDVDASSTT
jgi:hypothetical protein